MPKYVPRLESIMTPLRVVNYAFYPWEIFRHITWTTQYYCIITALERDQYEVLWSSKLRRIFEHASSLDVESSVQTGAGNCPEFDGGEYNNNIERGEAEFNIVVLRSINTEC
jgi:hypothetical protein